MASQYDINVRKWPFWARGDGIHDDTRAFRRAIARGSRRRYGCRIYVPPGKYRITNTIEITRSNITLFGDGSQSTLFIPSPWRQYDSRNVLDTQAYFMIGAIAGDLENIQIRNLRVQSEYDGITLMQGTPSNLFQIGRPFSGGVVRNSGFMDILAENLGGCAFAFNVTSENCYVIRNIIRNCAFTAINPFSGGHMSTIVSGNIIDGNALFGIEWSSQFALITNNIIRGTRNSAIAFENVRPDPDVPSRQGWTIFANNTILECGNLDENTVSAAIQIGESEGGSRIMIVNNVLRRNFGPGIVALGGTSADHVIHGNVIDEFGVGAQHKNSVSWNGISDANYKRIIVTGNVVRSGMSPTDRCDYGFGTGGSRGIDCWTDGNITIGCFLQEPFVTNQSAGQDPPSTGSRERIGLNVDITTGRPIPGFDNTNSPYIPVLPSNDTTPSVAGSNIWKLAQTQLTRITEFHAGYEGQIITIVFGDANTIIDGTTGNIRLVAGIFNSAFRSTLTLVCVGGVWIETARSFT